MDWADYLRDQAAKYRQLAETAENLSVKEELLDLAAICEETANNIEDRMAGVTSKVSSRSGRTFPIVPAARPIGSIEERRCTGGEARRWPVGRGSSRSQHLTRVYF